MLLYTVFIYQYFEDTGRLVVNTNWIKLEVLSMTFEGSCYWRESCPVLLTRKRVSRLPLSRAEGNASNFRRGIRYPERQQNYFLCIRYVYGVWGGMYQPFSPRHRCFAKQAKILYRLPGRYSPVSLQPRKFKQNTRRATARK